jgi:cysteinyl-tRNA synthetase
VEIDEEERQMIREREEARARRDFARADELRNALAERGVEIKDTPEGTVWKKRV